MLKAPATIQNIRTLADSTVRLQVDFQELPPEQMTELFELRQNLGWFLFAENVINLKDVPTENTPEFKNEKSPSKRLKDRMMAYWHKKNDSFEGFDTWYKSSLEEIGQKYLDKINEL